MSNLLSRTKKIGYYAGLIFGVGYSLTFVGYLAVFMSDWFEFYGPLYLVFSILTLTGVIFGVYLGITMGRNSKSVTDSGLKIESISSSVLAYSLMHIFMGTGGTIIAALVQLFRPPGHWAGPGLPLHPFIASIIGPILLLIGFWAYRRYTSKLKLFGAFVMVLSVLLIYLIGWNFIGFVGSGMLLSLHPLEGVAVLLAAIAGIIFALPVRRRGLKQSVAGIVLSVGGIIFSFGVIYYAFSVISSFRFINGYVAIYIFGELYPPVYILGNLAIILGGWGIPWIFFLGLTVVGVSGIIGLIAFVMSSVISAKQISATRRRDETAQTLQES